MRSEKENIDKADSAQTKKLLEFAVRTLKDPDASADAIALAKDVCKHFGIDPELALKSDSGEDLASKKAAQASAIRRMSRDVESQGIRRTGVDGRAQELGFMSPHEAAQFLRQKGL